jgi:hypothetical protein
MVLRYFKNQILFDELGFLELPIARLGSLRPEDDSKFCVVSGD